MTFPERPLLAAPAFDGMDLEPALRSLYGGVPEDATLQKLKGDASTRSYYRIISTASEPRRVVVMRLADDDPGRQGELPFVNMQRFLHGIDVPVPEIFVNDSARGVLLLEDLSDLTFEARLVASPRESWASLYERAIDVLAAMHTGAEAPREGVIAYGRAFDHKLLRWELEHFRLWGLDALDITLSATQRATLDHAFDALVTDILALPQGFAHRDYQSRNLMWTTPERLVVIDFQDALRGPQVYDLVALLCDSYVELDEALQLRLIAYMASVRGLSARELEHAFWLVAVQRKLKDAGRFVFIDQVRGNPDFLRWFGRSIRYAARALSHLPKYDELHALLGALLAGYPDAVATPFARTGSRPGAAP